ncbi:MAG: thermonuclease family protein [Candidatus Brocadiae bacterium]|nr:thermonuclease family protein [Candidatus Brocadiia bacterium]
MLLDGKDTTIRLIGVDTPETVDPRKPVQEYGKEASQFLKNLVQGEHVWLIFDREKADPDKYGWTLAYVHRAPDGLFVNLELVRQGYGFAYTKYPFQHMELFRYYEKAAREAGRGLWGLPSAPTPAPAADPAKPAPPKTPEKPAPTEEQSVTVYSTDTGSKYHAAGCRYLAKSSNAISLKDAVARGLGPCSVCKPPSK